VEPTRNVEGVLLVRSSFDTYDRPTTHFEMTLQYYSALSGPERHRVQFDGAIKQEFWKDRRRTATTSEPCSRLAWRTRDRSGDYCFLRGAIDTPTMS
jgi:hypothetical protein